jgi:hypothetical protein
MVLEVPTKSCAHGHNLTLTITATLPNKSVLNFSSTAKVEAHKKSDSKSDEISISLVQFDGAMWRLLTESFTSRQAQIEEFFASVKGT